MAKIESDTRLLIEAGPDLTASRGLVLGEFYVGFCSVIIIFLFGIFLSAGTAELLTA